MPKSFELGQTMEGEKISTTIKVFEQQDQIAS